MVILKGKDGVKASSQLLALLLLMLMNTISLLGATSVKQTFRIFYKAAITFWLVLLTAGNFFLLLPST